MERKTFYLHYTSIEALYEDILSELSKDYYQAMGSWYKVFSLDKLIDLSGKLFYGGVSSII